MAEQDLQDGLQLRDVAGKAPACKDFVSSQGFQQQHGANDPDQEDSASTDQQQQQQQEEAAQPLTETVAQGLQSMEERRQQLHAMIDELAQVGLHFFEHQRQQFLRTLESFKQDVDGFCTDEVAKGQQISYETVTAHERLSRAQLLVQSLGGAVCQPGAGVMG